MIRQALARFLSVPALMGLIMTISACSTTRGLAINSSATFAGGFPNPAVDVPLARAKGEQTAVVAGGCFWGIEAVFEHVKGVAHVESGYSCGSDDAAM